MDDNKNVTAMFLLSIGALTAFLLLVIHIGTNGPSTSESIISESISSVSEVFINE